jgi:phosphatidylglycerophosphate synthase
VTVVLVAPIEARDVEKARQQVQRWVDVLEQRGHDVYLVAPSDIPVRATHHVATRQDTADTVRAVADAMEGVPPPVLLLDGGVRGSVVTVEEVEAARGTVVLAISHADSSRASRDGASPAAPMRVEADVVVAAGSSMHQIAGWTHDGAGLLRVDARDADAVASAMRVMGDVAYQQRWHGPAWPLTAVAAVRAGVTVQTVSAGQLPWQIEAPQLDGQENPENRGNPGDSADAGEDTSTDITTNLDVESEARLRVRAATGPAQGIVDRFVGMPTARWLAMVAWRVGVGAHSVTALSVASALLAGLLIATGTQTAASLAAAFLLLSVLLDRVDGMLARARRTVTPFGAWLDVTSDRLREAALVIGLAFGAAETSTPRWALAGAVLALLTLSHLAAAANRTARGWGGSPTPVRLPLDRLDEPALPVVPPPSGRPVPVWLPFSVSRGDGAVVAIIGLVVLSPATLLTVLAVLATLSAVVCGLLVGAARPLPAAQRQLLALADPGPLALLVGRQDAQLSLLRRLVATPIAAWVPPATWAIESAAVLAAAAWAEPEALPVTLAWIGVLSFHRMDVATRLRELGATVPTWLEVIGLGAFGRAVLVMVLAAAGSLTWGLAIGAVVLGVVYAAESSGRFAER